ncbi:MAG: phenylacetate-CoA oxygenase subunit PaaI [Rhodobacteraceae bacterium]|nr:phenylacetate-CoA oxygenase subunit PaaI [Paracoccaceae bacterium]
MTGEMRIADYLAAGGKLTAPDNAPPRYRAELLRLMATFVDSTLAGAAGFADTINAGPGIPERIAAARIVMEKTRNAGHVLALMGDFGADTGRYVGNHPWGARLSRAADIGARRGDHDMRLAVFNYPLQGWDDAVVMNLLMGHAAVIQLRDLERVSYQPLARLFGEIAPVETRHRDLAAAGVTRRHEQGADRGALQQSVDYWWPRVAVSFGGASAERQALLAAFGLRHATGADQLAEWSRTAAAALDGLGLAAPAST